MAGGLGRDAPKMSYEGAPTDVPAPVAGEPALRPKLNVVGLPLFAGTTLINEGSTFMQPVIVVTEAA